MAFVPTKARAVMDKTMQGAANKRRSVDAHAHLAGGDGRQEARGVICVEIEC